jgi:chitin synthase
MITSFVQYLLMAPSFINVLNVYAVGSPSSLSLSIYIFLNTFFLQFANVHDVSWGTKGDNTVAKDLGTVATGKTGGQVEAEVPTDEKDIDTLYEDAIHVLNTKPPKAENKVDAGTKQEDYYRTFRTK